MHVRAAGQAGAPEAITFQLNIGGVHSESFYQSVAQQASCDSALRGDRGRAWAERQVGGNRRHGFTSPQTDSI